MGSFNVRVYGIMINDSNEVLLCSESYKGLSFTKFPGGGLEFGEGLINCLEREFLEETGCVVKVGEHFYTTDFFQASVFDAKQQLISIYYKVKPDGFSIPDNTVGDARFFWKNIPQLSVDDVTFPVDKVVVQMIKQTSK